MFRNTLSYPAGSFASTGAAMDTANGDFKRSRGRPQVRPDDETRRLIAQAARRAFMAGGYGGAAMDSVARDAGVSKKTLYRLVPTKADLFRAYVIDRITGFLLAVDVESLGAMDVAKGLERLLVAFGTLAMSQETIAIQKLVIGETERFPELAATFYLEAVATTHAVMARFLDMHRQRGTLELDDPHLAAGMLRGMMIMEPQRAAMLGQQAAPSDAEIVDRARACTRIFLSGCARPA